MAIPLFVWIELTRPPRSKPALVPVRVSTLVRLPALLKLVVCPAAVVTLFPPPGRFTVPGVFAPATAPVRAGVVFVPPRSAPPATLVFVPPRGVVLLGAPPRGGAAFG